MNKNKLYFVEVVSRKTSKAVKRIGCSSERKADKVEDGVNINLNHDDYFTRIVAEKGK